jgi:hypothetical protein
MIALSVTPAQAFLIEWEDLVKYFQKPKKESVHAINNYGSPISIIDVSVYDQGTARFKNLNNVFHTYTAKVKNNSGRPILSYELTWTMKHPFEDYVYHTIKTNSIERLDPYQDQVLQFRRDKHHREDAYYFVEVTKVQFTDTDQVWEAPKHDVTLSRWENLNMQINSEVNGGLKAPESNFTQGVDPVNGAVLMKLKRILIDK